MNAVFEADQFELPFMKTTHPTKQHGNEQNTKILNHLRGGGRLTALEALEWFKCFRLASRIHDLKKAGFEVQKRMIKTANGKSVAQYYL